MPARPLKLVVCKCSTCIMKSVNGVPVTVAVFELHRAQQDVSHCIQPTPVVQLVAHNPPPCPINDVESSSASLSFDAAQATSDLEAAFSALALDHAAKTAVLDKAQISWNQNKRSRHVATTRALSRLNWVLGQCDALKENLEMSSTHTLDMLLQVEFHVQELYAITESVKRCETSVNALRVKALDALDELQTGSEALRASTPFTITGPVTYVPGELYVVESIYMFYLHPLDHADPELKFSKLPYISQYALVCAVFFRTLVGISRQAGDLLIMFLHAMLSTIYSKPDFPKTIDSAVNSFLLSGRLHYYAVCEQCHCLYKPILNRGRKSPIYPPACSNIPSLGSEPCGATLLEDVAVGDEYVKRPKKLFAYHDFKDYLYALDSREDLRKLMDKACDDAFQSVQNRSSIISDIFQGDFFRTFKAPNDNTLFIDRPPNEGRYAFSCNLDFFNVEGLRLRGASTSCGILAMACMNLPIDIRYKSENMYVAGIIPGPREPNLEEINHYLKPLVDDLTIAWKRGIHLHRTVHCVVACAVCDLVGARKLANFAGVTSRHICSRCSLYGLDNYGRYDMDHFALRDVGELRQAAERWRDATSITDREAIVERYGVRWSEMWRLPYWNPVDQVVIDPMHCLLEGLASAHFRRVLRLTSADLNTCNTEPPSLVYDFISVQKALQAAKAPETERQANVSGSTPNVEDSIIDKLKHFFDKESPYFIDQSQYKDVSSIQSILRARISSREGGLNDLRKALNRKRLPALRFVFRSLQLQGVPSRKDMGTKDFWITGICNWVCGK